MKIASLFAVSLAGVLVASLAAAQYIKPWSPLQAEQAAGRQLFADHCAACHYPQPGANPVLLAPSLLGVVGRKAGSVPGFPYSDGLKNSGLVWTEENLQRWIADNQHMVPNTLMPHVELTDPAEQLYVVAYLKTLKARPK